MGCCDPEALQSTPTWVHFRVQSVRVGQRALRGVVRRTGPAVNCHDSGGGGVAAVAVATGLAPANLDLGGRDPAEDAECVTFQQDSATSSSSLLSVIT